MMRMSKSIQTIREEVSGENFLMDILKLSLSHNSRVIQLLQLPANNCINRVVPRITFVPFGIESFLFAQNIKST